MEEMTNANNTAVDQPTITVINPETEALKNEIAGLKQRLDVSIEPSDLMYQATLDTPPVTKESLYQQACMGDDPTIKTFKTVWIDHFRKNSAKYDFNANCVMNDYKKWAYKPVVCAGSGPSLRKNASLLKDRNEIGLVACLHSFAYLEDLGTPADYYITLDSQEITIGEAVQGGKKDEDYYWNLTKDRTLVAALVTNPKLLEKWQGRVLWFNTIVPDDEYMTAVNKIGFHMYFNVGGNALGACYYMARAVLGACPIAFIGADFSFSQKKKFHAWDSPYDQQFTGVIPAVDVFGNRCFTWPSYYNFAKWFEFIAMGGQGNNMHMMYNCTEGGILGSYPNGNLRNVQQMSLAEFLHCFNQHKTLEKLYKDNAHVLLF
jgi:Protein of unknown function DUF115